MGNGVTVDYQKTGHMGIIVEKKEEEENKLVELSMEQHPIPQNISSYEFKLVGDMTLKQFLTLAGGIALAFLINSTKIMALIRFPLMAVFAGSGVVLAFVPIGGRPASVWLGSFLKSIYSPTIYTYRKSEDEEWMEWKARQGPGEIGTIALDQEEVVIKDKNKNKIRDFLNSLPVSKKGRVKKKKNAKVATGTDEVVLLRGRRIEEDQINNDKEKKVAEDWRGQKASLDLKRERLGATGELVHGTIPMPSIPEIPNLVVGMVTDKEGKIVPDAIVEIQDEKGNPSRVLKTNSLGQFRTSTQLSNGNYLIIVEKEGVNFDRSSLVLTGKIVEPIKIRAKE